MMNGPVRGSADASAAIWNWRSAKGDAAAPSGLRRGKGVRQGLVGLVMGAAVYFGLSPHMGLVASTVSSFILISALVSPDGVYAAIERLIGGLVGAVGKGGTAVVMVPVFYLIFLPFGVLFRRGRSDGMKRFYDESSDSYWLTRETPAKPEDRERLF